ncbi:protein aveugle-like [Tubulanus polymorphus]|uniref:protein aveugle-like n=1 Tax=Tubulanus polymorphus TaxID=672921 RepID=UPI003DA55F8D
MSAAKTMVSPPHQTVIDESNMSPASPARSSSKEKSSKKEKRKTKPVYFWTSADVQKWMKRYCPVYFNLYGEIFAEHDITGQALIRLSDCKLNYIGVSTKAHRDEILQRVLQLRVRCEMLEFRNMEQTTKDQQDKHPS